MDLMIMAFVFALFVAAISLTLVIRRDFLAKQKVRRELELPPQLPEPRPRRRT